MAKRIKELSLPWEKLLTWSLSEYYRLPWRKRRGAYETLVSEIMLQQTTVGTVLNHFDRFISKYPNIKSLAKASEEQVLGDWKGLGYYRRARNLKAAADTIEKHFDGEIPESLESLLDIKGIGEYTARAILSLAYERPYLPIDANLERVLSRFYGIQMKKGPKLQRHLQSLFSQKKILEEYIELGPREMVEALMDLGRTYCQARATYCESCPLGDDCDAKLSGDPLMYPESPVKKIQMVHQVSLLRVVSFNSKGELLCYQKKKGQWLEGQLEVPTFVLDGNGVPSHQYRPWKGERIDREGLPYYKSTITKYRFINYLLVVRPSELVKISDIPSQSAFLSLGSGKNFATSVSKILKHLNNGSL